MRAHASQVVALTLLGALAAACGGSSPGKPSGAGGTTGGAGTTATAGTTGAGTGGATSGAGGSDAATATGAADADAGASEAGTATEGGADAAPRYDGPVLTGPVKIMVLGSSNEVITCWRAFLWQKLQLAGFTNVKFVGGQLDGPDCGVPNYDKHDESHSGIIITTVPASTFLAEFRANPPQI